MNVKVLDEIIAMRNAASKEAVERELALVEQDRIEGQEEGTHRGWRPAPGSVDRPARKPDDPTFGPLAPKVLWGICATNMTVLGSQREQKKVQVHHRGAKHSLSAGPELRPDLAQLLRRPEEDIVQNTENKEDQE